MHKDVLEWVLFLNTHDEFTYYYAYGDKDTFQAAFLLAGKSDTYYQASSACCQGGTPSPIAWQGARYIHARQREVMPVCTVEFVYGSIYG